MSDVASPLGTEGAEGGGVAGVRGLMALIKDGESESVAAAVVSAGRAVEPVEKLKAYVVGRVEFARRLSKTSDNHWANLHALIAMLEEGALNAWLAVEAMSPTERDALAAEAIRNLEDATPAPQVGTMPQTNLADEVLLAR